MIGGVLVAVLVALFHQFSGTTVQFATRLTDFLLLVFFTTVGLSAKFSALKTGGRPLLILCAVTVILLITQNIVGLLVAWSVGGHPFFGLLIGSVSLVGGPGTAAAWAKEAQAMGLADFWDFGLSSMPVAMATMDGVAARYGPSPKAFLLIALAGSFFVDLADAFIVKDSS